MSHLTHLQGHLEMLFPANLVASNEETKTNATKAAID